MKICALIRVFDYLYFYFGVGIYFGLPVITKSYFRYGILFRFPCFSVLVLIAITVPVPLKITVFSGFRLSRRIQ